MSSSETWTAVDDFLAEHCLPPDPLLAEVISESAAAGLPSIQVSPNFGQFLQLLSQMVQARRVLEIGTLGAYSTIWLARSLPPEGRLITLEIEPAHAEVARMNIDRAGLGEMVEVRLGPALESLSQLAEEGAGPFDLTFIDADKATTPEYFDRAVRLSRPGSVIVVDNVVRKGGILDAATDDPSLLGVRRFFSRVRKDGRVRVSALQTVGIKGYDGFAIALVTDPAGPAPGE